jgi:trimethylamine--corrinoid protein Co-methyltransferase
LILDEDPLNRNVRLVIIYYPESSIKIQVSRIQYHEKQEQPKMASETTSAASISPIEIKPDRKIRILSDEKLDKIHEAILEVLQKTGVRFPSSKALDIFTQAGAGVDPNTQIVKIQPDLLMKTLAKAPAEFVMGSRGNPELDVKLDGSKTHCGTAGTGNATVDLETRRRRASTKKDVATMAHISDYLSSISFYWPMVAASDCPVETIALHEIEASFIHTQKHVHIVSCVDEKAARHRRCSRQQGKHDLQTTVVPDRQSHIAPESRRRRS